MAPRIAALVTISVFLALAFFAFFFLFTSTPIYFVMAYMHTS